MKQDLSLLARFWDACSRNADKLFKALLMACLILFVSDFFYDKHSHFSFEKVYGFYAMYGFLAYVVIVLSAKQLRKILKRDENYYDD